MQISESRLSSIFRLMVELTDLFAKDETEHANLLAADLIKSRLGAVSVALFYHHQSMGYRFCLSGSPFPLGLTKEQWESHIQLVDIKKEIVSFGPWSLPGFDINIEHWLSLRLFGAHDLRGFLFIGRNSGDWNEIEQTVLSNIAQMISTIVGMRLTATDVETRLHDKDKRLKSLFEGSPDMIYTANAQDIITDINLAGVKLLGLDSVERAIGSPITSFYANPEGRQFELKRASEHGYLSDNETILLHADGTAVFCIQALSIIRSEEGETVEVQGIIKNITQRIISERELWRSTLELVDANKKLQQTQDLMLQHEKMASIGQLAAGVAHEINNPLGFLKSNQAMIRKYVGKIRDSYTEMAALDLEAVRAVTESKHLGEVFVEIEEIYRESEEGFNRIIRIVSDLKSFSRIDQGTGFDLFDVNAGIESTLIVAWNEIKYVAEVQKNFGALPKIRARGNEINQVILNVLVNAAQAIQSQNRSEKGLITITTFVKETIARIEIRDDGPGMPEEVKAKIFEPFFTTKDPGKGTGLGLSISYNIIVAKHGGKLYVETMEGKGTNFIIELPVNGPDELG